MEYLKQSTAFTETIGPILDSAGAEYTGAVIGDLSISKNGTEAAMAAAATLTHISNGHYTLVGTTGNSDTLGRTTIRCNKSTYQMPPKEYMVLPATVYDAIVTNATTAVGGLGDIQRMAGTALTARDIGASVLLSSGTGTGQLDFTSGVVKANATQVDGAALTSHGSGKFPADVLQFAGTTYTDTSGRVAAAFSTMFNVTSPVFTAQSVNQTGNVYPLVDTEIASILAAVDTEIADIQSRLPAALGANGNIKADVRDLLGTAWLTPGTAGTPDVNVKLWNALATVALPLIPTVAGRTLDVSATGEGGVDWANVGGQSTSVNLSGTTVNLVNTVTTNTDMLTAAAIWQDTTAGHFTAANSIGKSIMNGVSLGTGLTINGYTGNTPQTGDAYLYLTTNMGALGANLTAADDAVMSYLSTNMGLLGANLTAADDAVMSRLGAPAGASVSADIAAVKSDTAATLAAVDTEVAAILAAVDTEVAAIQTAVVTTIPATLAALFTTARTESYRADGATGSIDQLLYELIAHHGESSISGTTKTTHKVDGSTNAATYTLNSSSVPTAITRAS